ncbi:MAG: cupin domain-containing protein [Deltaproteobacteria bacterium]|nr:cupin domain-containing protein [Deltaproteobacteria bacterium]
MNRNLTLVVVTLVWLGLLGCSSVPPAPIVAGGDSGAATQLMVVHQEGGKTWNIFGLEIVGKVMSAQTGGQYSVIVSTTRPGGGPPRHLHENEDELFFVLEGVFEFYCGEEVSRAEKGALVVLPRGIPHGFRNVGQIDGMLMNTITPGGFEGFFEEIDRLPKDKPLDRVRVTAIAARYGLTFLPEAGEASSQP